MENSRERAGIKMRWMRYFAGLSCHASGKNAKKIRETLSCCSYHWSCQASFDQRRMIDNMTLSILSQLYNYSKLFQPLFAPLMKLGYYILSYPLLHITFSHHDCD